MAVPAINADAEFVRFKTTHRAHYEAFAPASASVFDTLLWNERGELTESTIANVVVELDGVLVTPPVACGLLAGTLRAELVDTGKVVERTVSVDDLARATALWLVNSVRGWRRAVLVERAATAARSS